MLSRRHQELPAGAGVGASSLQDEPTPAGLLRAVYSDSTEPLCSSALSLLWVMVERGLEMKRNIFSLKRRGIVSAVLNPETWL